MTVLNCITMDCKSLYLKILYFLHLKLETVQCLSCEIKNYAILMIWILHLFNLENLE